MSSRPSHVAVLVLLAFFLFPLATGLTGCATSDTSSEEPASAQLEPTVLLVSLDGFRWDYLDRYEAPTMRRLAAEGVRAERLIPSFPTKTFPNHYTLVTGLYPEHHGIIANNMYDPKFDAWFSLGNRDAVSDGRWWGGEPIWVTMEKQGRKTATFFWPGSEAEIMGTRPSYWLPFDGDLPAADRVEQVLDWLDLPAVERPSFLTLYFSDVDHAGHDYGPDAPETAQAVANVDGYINSLVQGLEARGLFDEVNLIIVSDHGMAATSSERVLFLDDFIDLDDVLVVDYTPVAMIRPKAGRLDAVYESLQATEHARFYRKEEVPDSFHFQDHYRIPDLIGIADEGWTITTHDYFDSNPTRFDGGTHGYNNYLPSMGALFIARGPAFAQGETVGPFSNIHVYNLMAAILGLSPAPVDGSLGPVRTLLAPDVVTP